MKIVHIDTGKDFRGGQRQVLILHKGLLKNSIDSFLICNLNGKLFKKFDKNIIPIKFSNNFYIKELNEKIKQLNPDIVHCHDSKSLNYFIFKKKSFKLIETRRVSYPIGKLSLKFKYSKCDFHVSVSEEIEKYLRKFFKNVITIHSCIEFERFNKEFENPLKGNFEKNILFVGAFSKQKGLEILLKAFFILTREFKNIGLHIVGSGKLKNKIQNIINYFKIDNQVILYGFRDDVEKFYKYCDIIVVPSVDGEGSSGVIKEALISGKITVASDLNENKILISHGENGFLFENKNYEKLYGILRKIIVGKLKLDKIKIKESVEKYRCEFMVDKYINLYKSLLNGKTFKKI